MTGLLNDRNFKKGFLLAGGFLAGVSESEGMLGYFDAFIVNTEKGESVYFETFSSLTEALSTLHAKRRDWQFEPSSGCSSGECANGGCKGGDCALNAKEPPVSLESAIHHQGNSSPS